MKELQFSQFVLGKDYPPFALITLNQDIDTPLYEKLTQRASFRVCADGGFDRLIQYCNANNIKLDTMLPNLLVGDLDSISPAALESARKAGVMVEKVHCQDTTDFQKSIKAVERHASADFKQHMRIIVVGAIDGRFDHTVASISVLYEYPKIEIWLLSKVSLIALLDAGTNKILIDHTLEGPTCGLLPMNGKCVASSTGLEYELDNHQLEMGKLVSSSNSVETEMITVKTDIPIIWTIKFASQKL